jgi:hypothetical protein
MAGQDGLEEVWVAADELQRYFEWVKEEIPALERRQLFEQIQGLRGSDLADHRPFRDKLL